MKHNYTLLLFFAVLSLSSCTSTKIFYDSNHVTWYDDKNYQSPNNRVDEFFVFDEDEAKKWRVVDYKFNYDEGKRKSTIIAFTFGRFSFNKNNISQIPFNSKFNIDALKDTTKLRQFVTEVFKEAGIPFSEYNKLGFVPVAVNTQFNLKTTKVSDYDRGDGEAIRQARYALGLFKGDEIPFSVGAVWENAFSEIDEATFNKNFTVYLARNIKDNFTQQDDQYSEKYDVNAKTFYDLFNKENQEESYRHSHETGGYYWTGGYETEIANGMVRLFTSDELVRINNSGINKYGVKNWCKNMWRVTSMWDVSIVPILNKWPSLRLDEKGFKLFTDYYKDMIAVFEEAVYKNHGNGLDSVLISRLDTAGNLKLFKLIQGKSKELQDMVLEESKAIDKQISIGDIKIKERLIKIISLKNQIEELKQILNRANKIEEIVQSSKKETKYNIVSNQERYDNLNRLLNSYTVIATKLYSNLSETISNVEKNLSGVFSLVNTRIEKNNNEIINSIRNSSEGSIFYMEEPPMGIDYEDLVTGKTGGVVGGAIELIKKGMVNSENMKVVVNKLPEPFDSNDPFTNATSKFKAGRIAASIGNGAFQFSTGEMIVPLKYIIKKGVISYPRSIEDLTTFFE